MATRGSHLGRILIIGSPGAGKSTTARLLNRELGLPLIHLDDEYWGKGWSRPEPARWSDQLRRLCERDRWIMDGNYHESLPLRLGHAQHVILLRIPREKAVLRILLRAGSIWLGNAAYLPREIQTEAVSGVRVQPTRDFGRLLGLAWNYDRTVLPKAVAMIARMPSVSLTMASSPESALRSVRTILESSAGR